MDAYRAIYFERSPCLGHVAHGAIDGCCNPKQDGAALEGPYACAASLLRSSSALCAGFHGENAMPDCD